MCVIYCSSYPPCVLIINFLVLLQTLQSLTADNISTRYQNQSNVKYFTEDHKRFSLLIFASTVKENNLSSSFRIDLLFNPCNAE